MTSTVDLSAHETTAPSAPAAHRLRQTARGPQRRQRTAWAVALLGALGVHVGGVAAIGLARLPADLTSPGGAWTWGGRMTGLLAEVLVLGLVLLAARVPVLEQPLGQDRLLTTRDFPG